MEQINSGSKVAPKLKDSEINDPEAFFEKIIFYLRRMYHVAGLVHGDLSAFNILNSDGEPVIIDVSQSVPPSSQGADDLLKRDCKNLCVFFRKIGLDVDDIETYERVKKKD